MRATLIAASAVAPALVLGTVALAQPRGGHLAGPRAATAAPTSASATSPSETGPAPPPPSNGGDGRSRLSPLNPEPTEISDAGMPAASVDYDRLLSDLASLRARAAAVGDVLFHSRIAISLQTAGDHGRVAALAIGLDDGTVWTAATPFHAEDSATVYDHAVAPGRHAVSVDIERRDDRDEAFRSSQRSRFVVDVPADARLLFDIRLSDDSNMGGSFAADKRAQYDLRVRAQAKAEPLAQSSQGK